ncbi:MAG: hypothetical protein AB7S36_17955, partial [Planctomycetota bacterium]
PVPDPPVAVRGGVTLITATAIVRLGARGTLCWEPSADALALSGRLRAFPLSASRLALLAGATASGLLVGGVLGASVLGGQLLNIVHTTSAPSAEIVAVTSAVASAVAAIACAAVATLVAWVALCLNIERLDFPLLLLGGARVEGDGLVVELAGRPEVRLRCMPDQVRQTDQLVDMVNRAVAFGVEGLSRYAEGNPAPAAAPTAAPADATTTDPAMTTGPADPVAAADAPPDAPAAAAADDTDDTDDDDASPPAPASEPVKKKRKKRRKKKSSPSP